MKQKKGIRLRKIMQVHPKRSKESKKRAVEMDNKPRFLAAAEERARQLNVSVKEILDEDLRHMRESKYPGPDCLEPHEVEEFIATGELSDDVLLLHIDTCVPCKTLLLAAKPREEGLQAFLEDFRYYVSQIEANGTREIQKDQEEQKENSRMSVAALSS